MSTAGIGVHMLTLYWGGAVLDTETGTGTILVGGRGHSRKRAVIVLGSFTRGNSPMAAGHGEMFRLVARAAEAHDQAGDALPVVMLAAPTGRIGTTPEALRAAQDGNPGPYLQAQLRAVRRHPSLTELEDVILMGHSFGGSSVPVAAQAVLSDGLDVSAMGIGSAVTVERRSRPQLIGQFWLESSRFVRDVREGNHEYFGHAARAEAKPLPVLRGMFGQVRLNLAIGGILGQDRLGDDVHDAYMADDGELQWLEVPTVIAYADRDRLTPVKPTRRHVESARHRLVKPNLITTVNFTERHHSWGDRQEYYQFGHRVLELAMARAV